MNRLFPILFLFVFVLGSTSILQAAEIKFHPITHASFVIESANEVIVVDPVGDISLYQEFINPKIILITHDHSDHLDVNFVNQLKGSNTVVFGPKVVIKQLGYGMVLNNGDKRDIDGIIIDVIAAYNKTKERLNFHPKGKGNGYVLNIDGKNIYISGDTEDIPEMRRLKNIDYSFLCMNLPYTMDVEAAAAAVLEFKPKVVYPYHYRGTAGFSDLDKFKQIVSVDNNINVEVLKWY